VGVAMYTATKPYKWSLSLQQPLVHHSKRLKPYTLSIRSKVNFCQLYSYGFNRTFV